MMTPSSMMRWLKKSPQYMEKFNNYGIILTDNTFSHIPLHKGGDFLHKLLTVNTPHKIEIGSHFPHFQYNHKIPLVSSISSPIDIDNVKTNNTQNISMITSVSNAYLTKFHNISLEENKKKISAVIKVLKEDKQTEKIYKKLYVKCVNQCPLFGTFDNSFILHEIFHYNRNFELDELCISDTNGTLMFDDYKYIVDTVIFFGVPKSVLSLDLYMNTRNISEIEKIIKYSLQNNISKFNVSLINNGTSLQPLSYEVFYEIVKKQIKYNIWYEENISQPKRYLPK